MHTPEEHAAAKKMIVQTVADPREYVARRAEADGVATDMIRQWAKTMNGTPALALLKIAASMIGGIERDVIVSAYALLGADDPDDMDGAADDLAKEAFRFAEARGASEPYFDEDRADERRHERRYGDASAG